MLYLDNAATTAPDPGVIQAMSPYLEEFWQNPSSGYRASKKVKSAIDDAREKVAELIEAKPEEIIFTSGGTESNNMALFSIAQHLPDAHFASSSIEHSAVLKPLEFLSTQGRSIHYLTSTEKGITDLTSLDQILPNFLSLMWVNNELGTIQPIQEALKWAQENKVPFHSDAVQAVGKIPISVKGTPVDMLSISSHKFNGPKGIGALYVREGFRLAPLLHGGGQESGWRSGTENVSGIIGMGKAAELAKKRLNNSSCSKALGEVRDHFESLVVENVSGATVNGDLNHRLPNFSHISLEGCEAAGLVILLDEYGVQCSAGSACMTGKQEASHVQKAMGFSEEKAKSSLRFSFSHLHTKSDAEIAFQAVKKAVTKLRSVQVRGVGPVIVYSPPS